MRLEIQGKRSDPDVAWRRLGDTDFLNRTAHAGKVEMSLAPVEGGASRILGTLHGPLGLPMRFVETRNGWVRHQWFRQDRSYERAPIARSAFLLSFQRDGDGVVPQISLELEPSLAVFWPVLRASLEGYRSAWQQVLDQLPPPGQKASPALARTLGPHTDAALAHWRKSATGAVVDAVKDLLLHERDHALRQLRAFAVADRFGLDRMDTLVSMLRAVPAGVLEMYWSVRCPRCSGEVASSATLSDIADHASCTSCRQDFTTDLSETVEVVFAPHPGVAPRVSEKFCTMFPAGAPELFATLPVASGERVEEAIDLPLGAVFRLGAGGDQADAELEVVPGGAREISFVVPPAGAGRAGLRYQVAPGALKVNVANDSAAAQRVLVARASRTSDVVAASVVATLPEFRRELGTQVLSRNVRIGSRSVCLLFTDLSGSTAMYEAIGDAAAYGLVRDHFEILSAVVEAHEGVIVKTIGDAVMASFHTASDGVRAALEMRTAFDRWIETRGLGTPPRLNVGVHVGPALAVHTDTAGMDWFGRTVNLAARAQSAAKDGAIVLTSAVWEDPLVAPLVAPHAAATDTLDADLKGIGVTRLWRIRRDSQSRGPGG